MNTLRTKFGVLLSVVIAGALLAFIFSLKTEMGFSGNDPEVGSINGEDIHYSEFLAAYDDVKSQMGELNTDQAAQQALANTWQILLSDYVFTPGFAELGLAVGAAEHKAMVRGERASNVFGSVFGNPQTGEYSIEALTSFLQQVESNPQAQQMWAFLSKQADVDRAMMKYQELVKKGAYATALEVERGVKAANNSYNGRYVVARYNTVADSLVTVSDSEIKAYYNANKSQYKQTPYRTISYVEYEVVPTEEDKAAVEAEAKAAAEQFAVVADIKEYSRENRHTSIAQTYITAAQMTAEEKDALTKGKMYGPALVADEWRAARVVDVRNVPEKYTLSHIVLNYTDTQLADSLVTVAKKGDFAALASQYSIAETAAEGGKIGEVTYSSLAPEFADALVGKKKGDIVKVTMGNAIQVLKIESVDAIQKHYKLASLTYPLVASQQTQRDVHNAASLFAVNAAKEGFDATVTAQAQSSRSANIEHAARAVRGIDAHSLEVVFWANKAKVGDVSELIKLDNNHYVIATLTGINDNEYRTVKEVASQIKSTLLRDKKFEQIAATMTGATIEEVAAAAQGEVKTFENVKYDAYYIPGIGVEPRVLGAIASLEAGKLSAPIKGASGVYVLVND
ncbi:MAG: SurA N-terminal domain-containing protein, partial [Alistipes sp.]|nr:SurA N-terminal domain-containing protein [Alistipes sp.]